MDEKIRELIEDAGWINMSMIIEVQGNDQGHVKESLEKMAEKIKNEKNIEVYATDFDETKEIKENWYSLNLEIKLIARDFGRLTNIALLYSPSVVEILEPKDNIKIPIGEAQNILVDISNVVTALAQAVFIQEGRLKKMQKPESGA
jgi:hypothetical protein